MTIFGQTLSRELRVAQDLDQADQSQKWVLPAMSRYGSDLVTLLWRILGNRQMRSSQFPSHLMEA